VKPPIRVLVVDDHQMFAQALDMLLAEEEDLDVAGAVGTAEAALEVVAHAAPDVVLMDIELPGMDGIEATRLIRQTSESTQVVIITAFPEPAVMVRAIEAGACGFIPKTEAADQLVGVVRQAAAGEMVLPAGEMRTIMASLWEGHRLRTVGEHLHGLLTGREIQILQGILDGRSTQELAKALHISSSTVQTHVKNILSKLGVHSKLEAVTFALRRGLIRLDPGSGEASERGRR
jgi:DNA-binding NarL/FixJ family response regulator